VHSSALYLKTLHTALVHRSAILEHSLKNNSLDTATAKKNHLLDEDVTMVRRCRLRPKLLTPSLTTEFDFNLHIYVEVKIRIVQSLPGKLAAIPASYFPISVF
jgi:hypothetical protein